jgi:HSP20 family molecular chaperone IbpA
MNEKTKENTLPKETPLPQDAGLKATSETAIPTIELNPLSDVFENEEGMMIVSDMPGVDGDSIDLSLDRKILSLEGRTPTSSVTDQQVVKCYKRQFLLPDYIDGEAISATFTQGVLSVKLPRAKEMEPQKITVSVN